MIPMPKRPPPSSMPRPKPQKPGVVFQPLVYQHMLRGINQIVDLIRPTLGPLPRSVGVSHLDRKKRPELLDSGGTIARRVIQLQDRDQDMGAMFIRHVLWELFEKVGDGTATAAVIFQSIFKQGIRYITAGGNAILLGKYLQETVPFLLAEIEAMSIHLEGKEALTGLAFTICHDKQMARMLGEIFDILGAYGRLEIRTGRSRELEREYVEGMYWDGGVFSRDMILDPIKGRITFEEPFIMISDLEVKEPGDLLPVLDLAIENGIKKLVLMVSELSGPALSILLSKQNREKMDVIAIRTPGIHAEDRRGAMEDLAILTGGLPLYKAAGDRISAVKLLNLGRARRIWADLQNFVCVGGKGDPKRLRQHIQELRLAYKNSEDADIRKRLLARIGKLLGGSATLWIGDTSPTSIELRKELAERTAEAMRGAMREGVVPGGGIALLNCRTILKSMMHKAQVDEQRVACQILIKALEEPTRTILDNAGLDDKEIMAEIKRAGNGYGYDVHSNQIVKMADAGIWDSTAVTRQIVFSAIHSAALALSTDVLVHRRIRPESLQKTG